jgi:hypothetical protein
LVMSPRCRPIIVFPQLILAGMCPLLFLLNRLHLAASWNQRYLRPSGTSDCPNAQPSFCRSKVSAKLVIIYDSRTTKYMTSVIVE